jgi:radical SAM superfamily enzyme YgiQ (UPF0313 family)
MSSGAPSARVLLVSANREEVNMPAWPLGLACVAAAAIHAGHDVRVLDLLKSGDVRAGLEQAIGDFGPEVIGISVRNIDDQRMEGTTFYLDGVRDIVSLCRERSSAPVVLGGAGYSIFPESALNYLGADFGLPGEGEAAFPDLVSRIKSGSCLEGPYVLHRAGAASAGTRSFIESLDDYPLPDIVMPGLSGYGSGEFWLPVQTRRGCAMECSYCSTPAIEGTRFRKRSPGEAARWLGRCADAGMRRFYFVDNTFNLPGSYALDLCRAVTTAGLDLSWRCIIYPWQMDGKLAEAMARAGCVEASIGSESGCGDMLRSMNKRFTVDDVRHCSDLMAAVGIRRMGFLMLGGPGETMASAEESLRFADSLGLESLKITIGIRIYPRTEVARRAVKDGIIAPDDDLLIPRFYMAPGLEEPLREMAGKWKDSRPGWIV